MTDPNFAASQAKKVILIAPAWVGDMVMAHTLVQCLAAQDLEIHVVAPAATRPLAERMAEVSGVHASDFAHGEFGLFKRIRLGLTLKSEKFDAAYVLPNTWKSALVPFVAGIKARTGWLGEGRYLLLNDRRSLDKDRYGLMIERFMALAYADEKRLPRPYPDPVLRVDTANRQKVITRFGLDTDKVIALCPGAEFGEAKKWPGAHYAELARQKLGAGYQIWLLGSPADFEDCQAIANLARVR